MEIIKDIKFKQKLNNSAKCEIKNDEIFEITNK